MTKLAIHGGSKVLAGGTGIHWPQFTRTDEKALLKVFNSGLWWRGGDIKTQTESQCGKFERDFSRWHGAATGLCVSNGTIAVELALRAAGVKAGDEVIVPALSFVVSASAALPLGAVPVFADCDPDTFQPDPESIEAMISRRTAAIVIVHFGGYPADLDRIVRIAKKYKLPLIEDCAHAHGSQWRGKGVGSYGEFGTFSFQQSKALTCGEGGIVLCKSKELRGKAYRFHNLGRIETGGFYDFVEVSSNYRMSNLQGAILNTQFARYKKQIIQKMAAHDYLSSLLREIGGFDPLPEDRRITRRGHYYFLTRYNPDEFKGLPRDGFLKAVQAEGVPFWKSYGRAIHTYPLFQNMKWPSAYKNAQYKKTTCPAAENAFANELCALPHTALLADRKTLTGIAEAVQKIKDHAGELTQSQKRS